MNKVYEWAWGPAIIPGHYHDQLLNSGRTSFFVFYLVVLYLYFLTFALFHMNIRTFHEGYLFSSGNNENYWNISVRH